MPGGGVSRRVNNTGRKGMSRSMPIKLISKIRAKLRGAAASSDSKQQDRRSAGNRPENGGGSNRKDQGRGKSSAGRPDEGEVWRPGDGPGKPRREESRGGRGGQRRRSSENRNRTAAGSTSQQRSADERPQQSRDNQQPSGGSEQSRGGQQQSRGGQQQSRGGQRPPQQAQQSGERSSGQGADAPRNDGGEQRQEQRPQRQAAPKAPKVDQAAELAAKHAAWSIESFAVEPEEGKTRFHDLNLPSEIMHSVEELGFKYCTPIQAGVLIPARQGRNVTGQAQTGTGKTAAFLAATFSRFHDNPKTCKVGQPRALVIAPTRELVVQIANDAIGLGKYSGFQSQAIYGGMDLEKQRRRLEGGPIELIAATPGRLLDFVNRGVLDLSQIEVLVIDEADRMLDMGFIPDVRRIVRATPGREKRQTLFFSATMNDDVRRLSEQWMPEPVEVIIEPEKVAVDTVKQLVYICTTNEKFKLLFNILNLDHVGRVLVFANRRLTTERLARELQSRGVDCELLSGAVNQNKRMRVVEDFKSGKVSVVVATDVAGRGLHVDSIDHVVNFELPYEPDDYVHRIGRTGRAGASGTAISFACEDESFIIPDIEKYIGEELTCMMPEEILLKDPPHPFRKPTVTTDSTPGPRGGGGGGGRRPSGGGGRRPSGGGDRRSGPGPRRSGTRHH